MITQGTAIILLTNINILLDPTLLFKTTCLLQKIIYQTGKWQKKKIASAYSEWLEMITNSYAI